jgi:hypothetical protein
MDMHASKILCTGLYKSQVHRLFDAHKPHSVGRSRAHTVVTVTEEKAPSCLCGGGGRPAALSVGQLVNLCTALSFQPTMASIASDEDVFAEFRKESRNQYVRMWSQFRDFNPDFDFESGAPGEEAFTNFIKFLRLKKRILLQLLSGPTIHVSTA